MVHKDNNSSPHHVCLTGCASTYHNYRRGSKPFVKGEFGAIDENEESLTSINDKNQADTKENDEVDKVEYNRERRRSSFSLAKLAPPPPDPLEGTWKLIQCENYEKYLEKIGTGPLSLNMVMRANVVLTITQELDKHWRIVTETSIKAKSVKGYATYNRKLTENKWKSGVPKPELVEDWDQRLVVTTLSRNPDGGALELSQVAEKDQKFCLDSFTIYQVDTEDEDILNVITTIDNVVAKRRFRRHLNISANLVAAGRRHSVC